MKQLKLSFILVAFTLTLFNFSSLDINAEGNVEPNHEEMEKKELTKDQIAEMKQLHDELVKQRKLIIDKYVEYGVMTEEKAKKMKEHLDFFSKKLKENGYIMEHKKHGHGHNKWEKDE
ncbi:DUF2680 domain-containing protein [Radiobacillus deserti]|uniref:DUF2680 domain-containing protein n=1 Tax=Radiobacillus deserti TaxID=2594883 RepID=A0A516KCI8_9BACI|nr:DUF2680 domain-containing protein [Radiobacillus deserti]QDP39123.1 DUF2680 domain-containing protein [Radiobacillus deserti]